ncbi:Zinc knuckle [Ceratocystis lukuohia]|uniref:Zinc knuckle n=1 Tax=Ceratocystis lukuohia TaxID=2019550 RepID=A0ABR4MFL0_9PEZI
MRIFSIAPLFLSMLVGVKAGTLEDDGYTLQKIGDHITITTYKGSQPVNEFIIDKAKMAITIVRAFNYFERSHDTHMSLDEILTEVCSEYDLERDFIKSMVINDYKTSHLISTLNFYHERHSIPDKKYATGTITPSMAEEWTRFTDF